VLHDYTEISRLSNNCYWNCQNVANGSNSTLEELNAVGLEIGSIEIDPMLDNSDLTVAFPLLESSPCVNIGTQVIGVTDQSFLDYWGHEFGEIVNIGASQEFPLIVIVYPVTEKGISRLAYQFTDSEKLKGFLTAFLTEYEELHTSGLVLLNDRYIDTAYGVQLDGIGEIVGEPRFLAALDEVGAFGFLDGTFVGGGGRLTDEGGVDIDDGLGGFFDTGTSSGEAPDATARGFGDLYNPDVGGNFWGGDTNYVLVGGDQYRLLIRAKIIKNQTAMTVDDTTRLISFLYDVPVRYSLPVNLNPVYEIQKVLDSFEVSLFAKLPLLIGLNSVEYIGL